MNYAKRKILVVISIGLILTIESSSAFPTLRSLPRGIPSRVDDFLVFRDQNETRRFYYVPSSVLAKESIRYYIRVVNQCEIVDRYHQSISSIMNIKLILAGLMEDRSRLVAEIVEAQRKFMENRSRLEVQKLSYESEITRLREVNPTDPKIKELEDKLALVKVDLDGINVAIGNFERARKLIDEEVESNVKRTQELQTEIDKGKTHLTRAAGEARIDLIAPHNEAAKIRALKKNLGLDSMDELIPVKIAGLTLRSSVDALKDLSFGDENKIREELGIYQGQWLNVSSFRPQVTHFGAQVSLEAPMIDTPARMQYQQVLSLIQICQLESKEAVPIWSELKVGFDIPIWRDSEGSQRAFSELISFQKRFRDDQDLEEAIWKNITSLPRIALNPDEIWPEDLGRPDMFTGQGVFATHAIPVEISSTIVAEEGK